MRPGARWISSMIAAPLTPAINPIGSALAAFAVASSSS
jgi:hypothetical protein